MDHYVIRVFCHEYILIIRTNSPHDMKRKTCICINTWTILCIYAWLGIQCTSLLPFFPVYLCMSPPFSALSVPIFYLYTWADLSAYLFVLIGPRLPKSPSQCYSDRLGNLGNLFSNGEMWYQSSIWIIQCLFIYSFLKRIHTRSLYMHAEFIISRLLIHNGDPSISSVSRSVSYLFTSMYLYLIKLLYSFFSIYLFVYLYTKILKVNLFAFAYRLFHEYFSSIDECPIDWREIFMKQSVDKCKQIYF